jgi:hypothetical protein
MFCGLNFILFHFMVYMVLHYLKILLSKRQKLTDKVHCAHQIKNSKTFFSLDPNNKLSSHVTFHATFVGIRRYLRLLFW